MKKRDFFELVVIVLGLYVIVGLDFNSLGILDYALIASNAILILIVTARVLRQWKRT